MTEVLEEEKLYAFIDQLPVYKILVTFLSAVLIIGFFQVSENNSKTDYSDLACNEPEMNFTEYVCQEPSYCINETRACYPPVNHSKTSANTGDPVNVTG